MTETEKEIIGRVSGFTMNGKTVLSPRQYVYSTDSRATARIAQRLADQGLGYIIKLGHSGRAFRTSALDIIEAAATPEVK